jgi:hypothetical protein
MKFDSRLDQGLYGNKQSAHDEEVSAAALVAAESVMMWYKAHPVDPRVIDQRYRGDWGKWVTDHLQKTKKFGDSEGKKTIDLIFTRCSIDHVGFGNAVNPFTILDFLVATLKFVFDLPKPSIAYTAIHDEFTGMRELCSSGYIERSVMALQGLPGAEDFSVTISERKRLFAAFSAKMAEAMKDAPADVLLGTVDEDHRGDYLSYMERKANEILPKLKHFEDSLEEHLTGVAEEYSSVEGWGYDPQTNKLTKPQ